LDLSIEPFKPKSVFRSDKGKKQNYPRARKLWNLASALREAFLNADRIKRKLTSLLVDGSTTEKKSWNSIECIPQKRKRGGCLLHSLEIKRVDLSLPNNKRERCCLACGKKISRGNQSGYCRKCRGRLILQPNRKKM
jgi:hypothetical protein